MSVLLWILVGASGAALMIRASHAAVHHAMCLGEVLRLSPVVLGVSVIALGTDLPEIVNSIVASSLGHGDINVGDSIGSVVVQASLVLGLLPFFAAGPLASPRRDAPLLAGLCIALLALGIVVCADGFLSRTDGLLLCLCGMAAVAALWRRMGGDAPGPVPGGTPPSALRPALLSFGALALVGAGATALVWAVIRLAAAMAVPEYLVSFFASALGTSLPELVVNVTALRRGQRDLALAGILGACLLDASVSVSAGPMFFPTAVSFDLAWRGALFAMLVMAAAGLLLGLRPVHDRRSGAVLVALYLLSYFLLLA